MSARLRQGLYFILIIPDPPEAGGGLRRCGDDGTLEQVPKAISRLPDVGLSATRRAGEAYGEETEWPEAGKYRSERRTAEEKGPEGLVSSVTAAGVPWLPRGLSAPRWKKACRSGGVARRRREPESAAACRRIVPESEGGPRENRARQRSTMWLVPCGLRGTLLGEQGAL
ncbi:hypothetical protein NDU88_007345 [Pleurodeles waltl]|uniref:Uncharacterized protein n=1 Tax=Pleurodeles waltl TaxID=8319 RepID=A0AAV7RSW9_PLEWA|nr:hypothetical protein NDU88_007345 [Pleurodeles waltl]